MFYMINCTFMLIFIKKINIYITPRKYFSLTCYDNTYKLANNLNLSTTYYQVLGFSNPVGCGMKPELSTFCRKTSSLVLGPPSSIF